MSCRNPRPGSTLAVPGALVVAVVLWVCALAECASAASDPAALIRRASRHYRAADYERAAALFTEADQAAGGRSLPAVAGLCRASLQLERYGDAIAAAERWIGLAETPTERADGYHHLGLGLLRRGLNERWQSRRPYREPLPGTDLLTQAVGAFRQAAADATEEKHLALLSLADALVWLGRHDEAGAALAEYALAGGRDPYAEELHCWIGGAAGKESAEAGAPREIGGDVTAPVKIHAPAGTYTAEARKAGNEGLMIAQMVVDEQGAVRCTRLLRASGLPTPMIRLNLENLKNWRFEPARLDGRPVAVYYNLTLNFSLHPRG